MIAGSGYVLFTIIRIQLMPLSLLLLRIKIHLLLAERLGYYMHTYIIFTRSSRHVVYFKGHAVASYVLEKNMKLKIGIDLLHTT